MNDTVSAATVSAATDLTSGGVRLAFLAPADVGQGSAGQGGEGLSPAWSAAHITGSVHTADAGPSLIVNFTTLAPDAYGWAPAPVPDQVYAGMDSMPATVSGYAASVPDDPGPGIVGALSSI